MNDTLIRTTGHDEPAQHDLDLAATGSPAGLDPESGMATAEYAIASIAAAGLAGLLIVILKSDTVRGLIEGLVASAFSI